MTLFQKLRDWIDDDPEGLYDFAAALSGGEIFALPTDLRSLNRGAAAGPGFAH